MTTRRERSTGSSAISSSRKSVRLKVELATTEIGTHVHNFVAVSEQGARSDAKLETVVDGTASPEVEIVAQNNPVEIGVETAYEIHVRNDGTKAAEHVAICCEMPEAVEMLRAEGATAAEPAGSEKGLLAFHPISRVEPGKTAIYRVYVRGRKAGNHRFRVRLDRRFDQRAAGVRRNDQVLRGVTDQFR